MPAFERNQVMRIRPMITALALLALLAAIIRVVPVRADDQPPSSATPSASPVVQPTPIPIPLSPSLAFANLWARTDDPRVRGNRPYLWGPRSIIPIITEPLKGAPKDT